MGRIGKAFLVVLTSLSCFLTSGYAQSSFPNRTVKLVVPFGPAGTPDIVARTMAAQLSEQTGGSFIVENRPGALGAIANASVAKSAPDGYTLLMVDPSFSVVPSLQKSLSYNPLKDFTAITQLIRVPSALVVSSAFPAKTLQEFVALAKANPEKYNYAVSGNGSTSHLYAELFKASAKINLTPILYNGGGTELLTSLLGGDTHMSIQSLPGVLPYIRSGQLRALAVTTNGERVSSLPDVPSMKEAGVDGMDVYLWFGMVAPAGVPQDILTKLHDEAIKALKAPAVKERLVTLGAEVVGSGPAEFSKHIQTEIERSAEIIKSAGISAN